MIRQFFNDVMPVSYQFSTVLYEAIRSAPRFDRDLAWNGEYFAPSSPASPAVMSAPNAPVPPPPPRPGRDRPACGCAPESCRPAVARRAGTARRGRRGARSSERAPRSRGIDDLEARAQHGDRASAGLEGTAMRRRVDARARPLTIVTPRGEIEGQALGRGQPVGARPPGTDDRDGQSVVRLELAAHPQLRRRRDRGQQRWVLGILRREVSGVHVRQSAHRRRLGSRTETDTVPPH